MEINLGLNINCSLIMQKIKEKNSNNCPNTNGDQNSLIESYLDQYGVNLFLNNTFEKFPIKTTKISRQAIILFIFLAVVFNSAKLINLDFSVPMLSLYGLLGIIFLDVIPRNSSHLGYFKRFIFTEEKNRIFIDNICTYQNNEIPREISLRNFSSSSINYFLEKIKCDPKKYHEYIIESFLRLTRLSPENLDLVFTAEILMHLRESFIINLLIKYRNQLSQNNITIYYNFFKLNDKMIRLLFATQNQSEFLYKLERDSLQLKQYYENFQLNKTVDFIKFDKKLPTRTENLWITIIFACMMGIFIIIIGMLPLFGIPLIVNSIVSPWIVVIFFFSMFFSIVPSRRIYRYLLDKQSDHIKKFVEYVSKYSEEKYLTSLGSVEIL